MFCFVFIGPQKVIWRWPGHHAVRHQCVNEWGQFVTTAVVVAAAAESEGFYARMARGLIARFRRANAPAPKCCIQTTTAVGKFNNCSIETYDEIDNPSDLHVSLYIYIYIYIYILQETHGITVIKTCNTGTHNVDIISVTESESDR